MKTAKFLLILLLSVSISSVFGQTERSIKEKGVYIPKQTHGATFGERKGWDGSIKGNIIEIVPAQDGITVIFPNDIAYKIDEAKKSVTELNGNPTSQNRPGNPIGGLSVKGGKNPGGLMRGIDKKDIRRYELPSDWTDGSYILQVSYEPQSENSTPATNERGKTKGKVISVGANFILEKQGASYAVSSVSSLGGGGGAAAASYAKTIQ